MRLQRVSKTRTAKERTFQVLKDRIMRQELKAGDSLPEVRIAKELGVSRTPVREAILLLQREGLAEVIPNRGAYVTFITLKELKNIIHLLQILEGAAAELAVNHYDISRAESLERELIRCKDSESADTFEETSKFGLQVHDLILKACGNERIQKITNDIREQIFALTSLAVKTPGRAIGSVDEHLRILKALKERNASAAKQATVDHLDNIYQILTRFII